MTSNPPAAPAASAVPLRTPDIWNRMVARGWTVQRLGARVPDLLDRLPWGGDETPWAHQRKTAEFFLTHNRALCLSGLGSGKTLAAIWAADVLLSLGDISRVVVIAPLSVLSDVWLSRLRALGERPVNLGGESAAHKARVFAGPARWILVNPDGLKPVLHPLQDAELIIVDEATAFKNPNTQRSRQVQRMQARRLWLMTGTPAAQSPMDALGLLRLIRPNDRTSAMTWKSATMIQLSTYKWAPRPDASATVHSALQPAIRFASEDCYDVPQTQYLRVPFDLSAEQVKLTKTLKSQLLAEHAGKVITAVNAAALASKLLQIECGGVYSQDENGRTFSTVAAAAYFDSIQTFVAESETPVLIFSAFKAVAERIAAVLGTPCLSGDTPQRARQSLFDAFRAGKHAALVAVPGTMSHGLTLVESNRILWATPVLSNETYQQANGRIVRPGQRRKCIIAHMQASAATANMYTALETKGNLQSAILNLVRND